MLRFLKFFKYCFATLFGCCLLLTFLAWLLVRGSLPQYTGESHLSGLGAAVTVERDTLGSVTITGHSRLDVTRALGFVHAQERFFEMDLMRRQAAGELAAIFGEGALTLDMESRQYRMRARARQILEQLPEDQRQLLTIYRAGVNAGLDALTVRPYPYLLTRTHPVEWLEEDTLLVIFSMFVTLNESSSRRELGLSFLRAELPDTLFRFLTASGGPWDAPLTGEPLEWPPLPPADDFDLSTRDVPLLAGAQVFEESMPGSNNFAVAGNLAAFTNGAALVANDMHLTLRVPNLWFRTRLITLPENQRLARQTDITGITLPGVPAIVIGSNRHIAWSFTNSYGDFTDWVRVTLDPDDRSRYLGASGWQSVRTFPETIHVRNAPTKVITVRETEWGPIVARDHDGAPLAIVWTAFQPGGVNLNLIELEHAQTADDAAIIAQQTGMPAQNFIVGDKQGNILWTIAGRIPLRSDNFDPRLPADWSTPGTGWLGWLNPAEYPLIRNPDSGRLWTANTRTVNADALPIIGDGGYDLGARSKQIRDNLFALERFTADDLFAIQLDHRAIFFTHWHTLLLDLLKQSKRTETTERLEQVLKDWDGRAAADSVAYRIVRGFRHEVIRAILTALTVDVRQAHPAYQLPRLNQAEHAVWRILEERPIHLLPANYNNWDDFLSHCVTQAIEALQQQPGDITARTWGEDNAAHIRHPLSRHLPKWLAHYLDMPADPLPGDVHMPRIQTPDFGASQRSVVAPGKEEAGYFDMPGGQSGHPLSPYYGSGHAGWVSGRPTPFMPGKTKHTLILAP